MLPYVFLNVQGTLGRNRTVSGEFPSHPDESRWVEKDFKKFVNIPSLSRDQLPGAGACFQNWTDPGRNVIPSTNSKSFECSTRMIPFFPSNLTALPNFPSVQPVSPSSFPWVSFPDRSFTVFPALFLKVEIDRQRFFDLSLANFECYQREHRNEIRRISLYFIELYLH